MKYLHDFAPPVFLDLGTRVVLFTISVSLAKRGGVKANLTNKKNIHIIFGMHQSKISIGLSCCGYTLKHICWFTQLKQHILMGFQQKRGCFSTGNVHARYNSAAWKHLGFKTSLRAKRQWTRLARRRPVKSI